VLLHTDKYFTYVCMYVYIYKFHLHTIPKKSTTDFALGCGSPSLSRTSHSEVRRCGSQIGPVGRDSTWSLLTSGFHGCRRQKPYQVVPKTKRNMPQNCSNHGKINTSFQSGPKLKSDPCWKLVAQEMWWYSTVGQVDLCHKNNVTNLYMLFPKLLMHIIYTYIYI